MAWEVERTQLRGRISQLLAENRSLRFQLGQLHAQLQAAHEAQSGAHHLRAPPGRGGDR